jgi:hypothetical protein
MSVSARVVFSHTILSIYLCNNGKYIRGPFEKFVDSPYYSKLELCGGVVIVSFFEIPPLASIALLTMLHPLFEIVPQTVCRKLQEDSGTGSFDLSYSFLCL